MKAEDFVEIRAEPDQYAVVLSHARGLRVVRQTGDYAVVLRSGKRLRMSRRYKDQLFARMGR